MRLLSYNIHKGIGGRDRQYRLERVMDVIEEENPDVICLQEVDHNVRRSRHHNQAKLLVDRMQAADYVYRINHHIKRGGYGNLILSRWTFESRHEVSLQYARRRTRNAHLVVVNSPEGPLHVVNCHLGLAEKERHWQVRHLLSHSAFRSSAHLPTVVLGDTNDWRNTLAKNVLAEHDFRQITAPPSRFRTFPAYLAIGSLDKAFVRGPIQVRHVRVVRGKLAKKASDHLPLVVDLHLDQTGADALQR